MKAPPVLETSQSMLIDCAFWRPEKNLSEKGRTLNQIFADHQSLTAGGMCRCEVRRHLSHLTHVWRPRFHISENSRLYRPFHLSLSAFADCPSVSESLPPSQQICQLLFNAASSSYAAELSAWTLELGIFWQEDALKGTRDL